MLGRCDWPFIGRTDELAEIERALLTDGPGLVLFGEAGVGKTALLRATLDRLEAAGVTCERVSATSATASIPFGAVSHLLPARMPPSRDPAALYAAVRRAFAQRGGDRPVVIGVDDAHLLDDPSAGLLHQLTVHGLARALVTVRTHEPLSEAFTALWTGSGHRFTVRPLSAATVDDLLDVAVPGPLDALSRRRLHRLAAGNPLLLRELLADAHDTGALRGSGGVWRWYGTAPGSPRLTELVSARLRALDPAARRVLEVVACGEPLSVALLERLAQPAAVEAAERSGMAVPQRDGARTALRLSHPLYGEALRASMPQSRARVVFGQLADALADTPLRRADDALRAGVWQLRSGTIRRPDILLAAARQAVDRFDIELAERLARAARGGGPGWEADWLLARVLQYQARSQEAFDMLPPPPAADSKRLAIWAITRAGLLYWGLDRIDEAHETLHLVPDEAPGKDLAEALRSWILFYDGRCGAALRVGQATVDRPGGSRRVIAWATMGAAAAAGMLGDLDRATEIVRRGRELIEARGGSYPWGEAQIGFGLCYALRAAGLLHQAAEVADGGYRAAVGRDARGMTGVWAGFRGVVAKAQGRLDDAEANLREAIALLTEYDQYHLVRTFCAELAAVRALLGDAPEAQRWMAAADARKRRTNRIFHAWVELDRAWVVAADGDRTAAVRIAARAAELARASEQPTIEAVALYDCARLGAAQRVRDRLVEVSTRLGGVVPTLAVAAGGLADQDRRALSRAAERFTELGHFLLAAEAAAAATGQRAPAWSARPADRPLERDLARTPLLLPAAGRYAALTSRERDVAVLAATLPSREVADRLGLSVNTVNNNLARVYSKVGVRSRRELALLLGGTGEPSALGQSH